MNKALKFSSINLVAAALFFQVIVVVSVLLDLFVFRQVLGVGFYLFVPGALFVLLFKLGTERFFEKIIFSVALSVCVLLILGLALNSVYPLLSAPLSTLPVLIFSTLLVLCQCVLIFVFRRNAFFTLNLNLDAKALLTLFFAALLPLLAVIAAFTLNNSQTSAIPLTIVFVLSAFIVITALSTKKLSDFSIAVCIYAISLSVLLFFSLRSGYVLGVDGSYENFVYSLTNTQKYWDYSFLPFVYNSCASVTIFPTALSSLLNISGDIVFKLVFQFLFALMPVVLYLLFRRFFSKLVSFLGIIVFIGQEQFNAMSALLKQELALLFFVLILFLMFKKEKKASDFFLLVVFGFIVIVSHYATAYLMIALLIVTFLSYLAATKLVKRITSPLIGGRFVLVVAAITVVWYSYLFTTPSLQLGNAIQNVFHSVSSTGIDSSTAFSYLQSGSVNFADTIGFSIGIFIKLLMFLGLIFYFFSYKKFNINLSYAIMMATAFVILALAVILPALADTFVISRFVLFATIFLAPMAIVGLFSICDLIFWFPKRQAAKMNSSRSASRLKIIVSSKAVKKMVAVIFSVLYLLVGLNAWSVALGGTGDPFLFQNEGVTYDKFYTYPQEVGAVAWLSSVNPHAVYCDRYAVTRCVSYGGFIDVLKLNSDSNQNFIGDKQVYALDYSKINVTSYIGTVQGNVIFLRYQNVVLGQYQFIDPSSGNVVSVNSTELPLLQNAFYEMNAVYDNGACRVFV